MTEDYRPFTVDVPADFEQRFASVLEPGRVPYPGIDPRFEFTFPAELLPDGMGDWLGSTRCYLPWDQAFRPAVREVSGQRVVTARSKHKPMVIPGFGSCFELSCWGRLMQLCDDVGMPREWAFRRRAVRLLVQPVEFDTPHVSGISLSLKGVQVSDLSEGFLRDEINRRLREFEEC